MTLHEDILNLQTPDSVRISPNAESIVYCTHLPLAHKEVEKDHAVSTIWLATTGKRGSARPLTNGWFRDQEPKWSPTGESIAFLSDRAKAGETSAIYVLSLDGGEPYPVTPANNLRSIDAFEFSPDGKTIAFISPDEKSEEKKAKDKAKDDPQVWGQEWPFNRLRLVNVATKNVTTIVSTDVQIIDFAWNDNGSKIAFATVDTPDSESSDVNGTTFYTVDVSDKTTAQLCDFPTYIGNFVYSKEKIHFIGQVSEKCLVSATMVYTIDPALKSYGPHEHGYGMKNCARDISKVGQSVIVEVEDGMDSRLCTLGGTSIFSKKQELACWDVVQRKKDDEFVIAVALSSTDKPHEIYSGTGSNGELVQLSEHGRTVADRKFGSGTFLSCPSADNKFQLEAVWHTPPGFDATNKKALPTVVVIHGGPYGRHTDAFDNTYFMWGPLLLDAGYALLVPNYRGSSGQGEAFAAYARGAGKYDYEDVITLTQHAVKTGHADPKRLIAAGWSFGGFLSYLATVRNGLHGHGWRFAATIPGAGTADVDTSTLTSDMGIWKAEIAGRPAWQSAPTDTSNRRASALWEFAAAARQGIVAPVLILHGERDERVGVEQARGMRRALMSARLPFELVIYPREPHMISERNHLLDMGRRIHAFVEKHIGPGIK